MKYFLLVTLSLISIAFASEASELDEPVFITPVIVVTGTQTEKLLSESPVPVRVINRKTIEESGSIQLNELLKTIPGIRVNDQHGQQGQSLMMQGMDSQHVLILVDGIPVTQTSTDTNTERLMLHNVERIEIVPGGSSALYGSSAMGGVINIITSQPTENYVNGSLTLMQSESDLSRWPTQVSASLNGGRRWNGLFFESSNLITQYAGVDTNPDDYGNIVASGYRWDLSQKIKKNNLSLSVDWMGGRLERPYLEQSANNFYEYKKIENSDEFDVLLKHETNSTKQTLQLEHDNYKSVQDLISTEQEDFTRQAVANNARGASQWTTDLADHEITFGAVGQWSSLKQDTTNYVELEYAEQTSIEAFIQDDLFIGDFIELISGARAQWDSAYDWYISPKISARWDIIQTSNTNLYLRSSVGLGYRVPSLKEREYVFDHSQYGYRVIGNSNLEPEESLSSQIEIGGDVYFRSKPSSWSVALFQQDVSDLITTALDNSYDNGLSNYVYQNINSALIEGIDIHLNTPLPIFGADIMSWQSSYQYLNAQDADTNLPLNYRPAHSASQSLRFAFSGALKPIANIQWQYTGQQYISEDESQVQVDGFHQVNIDTSINITPDIHLSFAVTNVLDKYQQSEDDSSVLPTTGRAWRVALNF